MWVSESGSAIAGSGLTEDITAALVDHMETPETGAKLMWRRREWRYFLLEANIPFSFVLINPGWSFFLTKNAFGGHCIACVLHPLRM